MGCCSACFAVCCYCMTAGWGETEVPMDVSTRRLALVLHHHLAEHGLLSFLSLLGAFLRNVLKRNLLLAHELAGALATPVTGHQEALDAIPEVGTHTTPPDSPATQHQAPQSTPPRSPPGDQHRRTAASPTERMPPTPFPRPDPNAGRPPPPDPPPPRAITEQAALQLAQRMARHGEADRIQGDNPGVAECGIRASYYSILHVPLDQSSAGGSVAAWLLKAHIDHFATIRIQRERRYRAIARQWHQCDWLVRNAYTDQEGTETVNGADSTLWDTDLDGYLSTDTHRRPIRQSLPGRRPLHRWWRCSAGPLRPRRHLHRRR